MEMKTTGQYLAPQDLTGIHNSAHDIMKTPDCLYGLVLDDIKSFLLPIIALVMQCDYCNIAYKKLKLQLYVVWKAKIHNNIMVTEWFTNN